MAGAFLNDVSPAHAFGHDPSPWSSHVDDRFGHLEAVAIEFKIMDGICLCGKEDLQYQSGRLVRE